MGEATTNQPHATSPAVLIEQLSFAYPVKQKRTDKNKAANDSHTAAQAHALNKLDLRIERGQCFGLLGPNGSGKTTLFKILCTSLQPKPQNVQTLKLLGRDVQTEQHRVREQLGVVFQSPSLDDWLTVHENLLCHARLYGMTPTATTRRITQVVEQLDITARLHDRVQTLSGGLKRRVELAKAMLHEPALLLLDEPSTGLDPAVRREFWQIVHELSRQTGVTVIFTTHMMDEAEQADELAMMNHGAVVCQDRPDVLRNRIEGDVVLIEPLTVAGEDAVQSLSHDITDVFPHWAGNGTVSVHGGCVRIETHEGEQLVHALRERWPDRIQRVSIGKPSLEDVYLHLTQSTFEANQSAIAN